MDRTGSKIGELNEIRWYYIFIIMEKGITRLPKCSSYPGLLSKFRTAGQKNNFKSTNVGERYKEKITLILIWNNWTFAFFFFHFESFDWYPVVPVDNLIETCPNLVCRGYIGGFHYLWLSVYMVVAISPYFSVITAICLVLFLKHYVNVRAL